MSKKKVREETEEEMMERNDFAGVVAARIAKRPPVTSEDVERSRVLAISISRARCNENLSVEECDKYISEQWQAYREAGG